MDLPKGLGGGPLTPMRFSGQRTLFSAQQLLSLVHPNDETPTSSTPPLAPAPNIPSVHRPSKPAWSDLRSPVLCSKVQCAIQKRLDGRLFRLAKDSQANANTATQRRR